MNLVRALVAALIATAPAVAFCLPAYTSIDGRWYAMADAPRPWWSYGVGIYSPSSTASNCRRSDGQPQAFGPIGLYLGQFFYPVYRIKAFAYRSIPQLPGYKVLEYRSESGNVICDNEIPSPIPDPIFASGFQGSVVVPVDRVFADSFQTRGNVIFTSGFER